MIKTKDLKSFEMHSILLLQIRVHKLFLLRLKTFIRVFQLTFEIIQKSFIISIGIQELLTQMSEIPQMPKHVILEEQDWVVLQLGPSLNFPLFAVGSSIELGHPDGSAFIDNKTRLNYQQKYTFSKASETFSSEQWLSSTIQKNLDFFFRKSSKSSASLSMLKDD